MRSDTTAKALPAIVLAFGNDRRRCESARDHEVSHHHNDDGQPVLDEAGQRLASSTKIFAAFSGSTAMSLAISASISPDSSNAGRVPS